MNALGVCKRSVAEVKENWKGMVGSARKEHNKCAVSQNKTRGGRKPDFPKGTTVKIIQLFEDSPSFSGISSGLDSGKSLLCLKFYNF